MSDLFRHEAIANVSRRLPGVVVLATPPSVKLVGLFLAGVVFAALAFAATATYARKATVQGWLVPDRGLIRATAAATGLVQDLAVREGDRVERGARIATIGLAAEVVAGNVGEIVAQQLRIEADAAKARARAQSERLEGEARQTQARLANSRLELEQTARQVVLQEQRLEIARQELARGQDMASRGNLALREVDIRRSAALAAEQELANFRRQAAGLEREIADISARIIAIPIEVAAARAEALSAEASLRQRSADAEARSVQFLLAPIAGRVAALPVSTGQAVAAGATIAVIVPDGARLEAELLAPSRAAGFVRAGQEVQLMLQAFPHQRFGTVAGHVRMISTTVLGPTEISIPGLDIREPVFRVRVSLSRENVDAYGEAVAMQPGMLLAADIVFDRRSLVHWLFDPLFAVARRS
jgi:membrane fusion protein